MSVGSSVEARIHELEAKISLAENTIEELSGTIYQQQRQIDQLRGALTALSAQTHADSADQTPGAGSDPRAEIPPHY